MQTTRGTVPKFSGMLNSSRVGEVALSHNQDCLGGVMVGHRTPVLELTSHAVFMGILYSLRFTLHQVGLSSVTRTGESGCESAVMAVGRPPMSRPVLPRVCSGCSRRGHGTCLSLQWRPWESGLRSTTSLCEARKGSCSGRRDGACLLPRRHCDSQGGHGFHTGETQVGASVNLLL